MTMPEMARLLLISRKEVYNILLTGRDKDQLDVYKRQHTTPSAGEISMGVGIPRTTAYRYLVEDVYKRQRY